jgi:thioredoxin 1
MDGGEIRNVSDDDFESEVLKSGIPVLVDFYADWCGPCKTLEPTMKTLSNEYSGKIKFVKVNVDHNQAVSMKYEIMGIPTAILFGKGEIVDSLIGVFPIATYRQRIDRALKP